jgi:hypothetical protein
MLTEAVAVVASPFPVASSESGRSFKESRCFFSFKKNTHLPKWTKIRIYYLDPKQISAAFGARSNAWYTMKMMVVFSIPPSFFQIAYLF